MIRKFERQDKLHPHPPRRPSDFSPRPDNPSEPFGESSRYPSQKTGTAAEVSTCNQRLPPSPPRVLSPRSRRGQTLPPWRAFRVSKKYLIFYSSILSCNLLSFRIYPRYV